MKRIFLTMIISFLLCLSFQLNTFASGVGGALDVVQGSNIDPRTDSRYKDNYELDLSNSYDKVLSKCDAKKYGDVVLSFIDYGSDKAYKLKAYIRFWYDDSFNEYGKPCLLFRDDISINGSSTLYDVLTFYMGNSQTVNPTVSMTNCYETVTYTFATRQIKGNNKSITLFDYYGSKRDVEILYSDFPIFQNQDDLTYYLETGIIRNAFYDASVKDYSSELYFESFEVIPHASNRVGSYYFDVKYELSDYAKKNIDKLNLNFENMHQIDFSSLDDLIKTTYETKWYSNSIALSNYPYGFCIYVKDLGCYAEAVEGLTPFENIIIGNIFIIDTVDTILQSLMPNVSTVRVERSVLYFKFNLRFSSSSGAVFGKRNDFTYDFISKENSKNIYTPNIQKDNNGNTTFVKDADGNITYTQEGDTISSNDYYYNNVEDDGDTVVNNYFYYDKDGNEKKITEDEYNNNAFTVIGGNSSATGGNSSIGDINININNNMGHGDYVDISPSDYKLFIDALQSLFAELDTNGGLFLMLGDIYSMFPTKIWLIVGGGLSAVIIVSVIKIARG